MTHRLVIMRHASAAMVAASDSLRPLTERGVQEAHRSSCAFPFAPSVIYYSPYLRAEQTAVILASYYPYAELKKASWLTPETNPASVVDQLSSVDCDIALVSHQPLVGSLAALLIHGNARYSHDVPFLSPACMLELKADVFQPGCADLINTII